MYSEEPAPPWEEEVEKEEWEEEGDRWWQSKASMSLTPMQIVIILKKVNVVFYQGLKLYMTF